MKKIEKLVAKIGYNTAKKTVNSASVWHSHQVKEPASEGNFKVNNQNGPDVMKMASGFF